VAFKEIKVPTLAESIAEATVLNWHKQPGEAVQEGDKLVDIETDKVILEVVASTAGILVEIIKVNGTIVLSEEVIGRIDTAAQSSAVITTPQPTQKTPTTPIHIKPSLETVVNDPIPKTSPAARKIAAEQGIDLLAVPHQGDRVTKTDVLQQAKTTITTELPTTMTTEVRPIATTTSVPTSPAVKSTIPSMETRPEERVPMTRIRKRIAERLLNAQHEHAILTTFNEINMKAVTELRNQHREEFEKKYNIRLGFMSFFVKAAVSALKKFPVVNASIDGHDVIYHGYYDIGVAVSSPRGLVVPILRDTDLLSFAETEKKIAELGLRAREAQLSIEELSGGTFSITNGGIFGSMLSTPILNPPQSAILGMHNIVERPIAEDGQVVIRPIMYVALSYDHRLIDGRDAVQFLVAIKRAVENPTRLLLEI